MEWLIIGLIIWVACATFTAGIFLAYSQKEWPSLADDDYKSDKRTGWALGLIFGPVSIPAMLIGTGVGKHGFMNPFVARKQQE